MAHHNQQSQALLDVSGLKIHFFTGAGVVQAIDGVEFGLESGETLGLVGESGSGKTISSLALLKLVPRPGKILGGHIRFENDDLIDKSEAEMIRIRGKRIAMIFQNPAFSLNPIYSIGQQLGEIMMWHEKINRGEANDRVTIVGGALDGRLLEPAEVKALAELPSLDELLAMLIAMINTPAPLWTVHWAPRRRGNPDERRAARATPARAPRCCSR